MVRSDAREGAYRTIPRTTHCTKMPNLPPQRANRLQRQKTLVPFRRRASAPSAYPLPPSSLPSRKSSLRLGDAGCVAHRTSNRLTVVRLAGKSKRAGARLVVLRGFQRGNTKSPFGVLFLSGPPGFFLHEQKEMGWIAPLKGKALKVRTAPQGFPLWGKLSPKVTDEGSCFFSQSLGWNLLPPL